MRENGLLSPQRGDNAQENTHEGTIIPETIKRTNLGSAVVGQRVHLEADMIGKWVEQLLNTGAIRIPRTARS